MLQHFTGVRIAVAAVLMIALQCAGYGSQLHTQTGWQAAAGTAGRFEPYAPLDASTSQVYVHLAEGDAGWNCTEQGDRRCYAGARVQYQP